jgi:hypothetical protein
MGQVIVICAWCRKKLRGPETSTDPVSHGICAECQAAVLADAARRIERKAVA